MRLLHRSAVTALFVVISTMAAARGDSLIVGDLNDAPSGSDTIDWVSQPNAPYLIGVTGTPVAAAVPEQSSWIVDGLGFSSAIALLRRRTATIAG